jgi:hypothetical protein
MQHLAVQFVVAVIPIRSRRARPPDYPENKAFI